MLSMSPTVPEQPELSLVLAQFIEKCVDLGNSERATRLQELLEQAIAVVAAAANAPAADLVSGLAQSRSKLESLLVEAKLNADASDAAKASLIPMIDALKNIKI